MNFDALRQKIIEKAIRGELVPQLESEPEVTLDHVVKTDSPFPIPKKWQWASLGDVATLISGRDLPINEISDSNLTTPYITGASQISRGKILINRWTENPTVISEINDVLITCKGTVGNLAVNKFGRLHIARQIMAIRPGEMLSAEYLLIYLKYIRQDLTKEASGLIPGITRDVMLSKIIAIPPIREQARIVSYLNNLLRKINVIEQSYSILNILSSVLEKKVLQTAIEGNLVPQLESEPSVTQIGQAPVDEPFSIPSKWKWISLSNALIEISDGSHNPPPNAGRGIPVLSAKNVNNGVIDTLSVTRWVTEKQWSSEDKKIHIEPGDVLLTIVGTIGRTAVVPDDAPKFMLQRSVCVMKPEKFLNSEFLALMLTSPMLLEWMVDRASGTAQRGIYLKTLKTMPLPIPPLPEQHRIVRKLKEILSFASPILS